MAAAPKNTTVTALLADIAAKDQLRVGALSQVVEQIRWLSTGNLGIDWAAGNGLPVGRSVELYGPPSSGKTTTGLQTAAGLQADIIAAGRDEHILYLDYEHALDAVYCRALGLDVEHPSFLLAQPHAMEQGVQAALKLIETGKIRLVIWDSVAAMAPLSRLEGDFDQRTAAMNKARLMSGLMLMLTPMLDRYNTASVFINHLMEAVDMNARSGIPPRTTTPGGRALKYYASVRLEYRQTGNTRSKLVDPLTQELVNQATAAAVKVSCTKNKVADPGRSAEVRIRRGRGFDNTWSALQLLLDHKRVMKEGGWYRFDAAKVPDLVHPDMTVSATGRPSINGESAVLRFADEHPQWRDQLIAVAGTVIRDNPPPVHGPAVAGELSDEDLSELLGG